ncbi:MAG: hypothetical protein ACK4V6_06395, partial [Microthrixaceae bacterium]
AWGRAAVAPARAGAPPRWPPPPRPGTVALAEGAVLSVGRCGAHVVVLDGPAPVRAVLEGSWRVHLRRIDVLVVTDGRSREAAHGLEEQLRVLRRMEVDPGDPEPEELAVGDLVVRPDGRVAPTEGSGAACRLTQ